MENKYAMTGLGEDILLSINRIFFSFPNIEKAVLFGSRAKGTYTVHSDIDIAYWGDLTTEQMARLYYLMDNLPFAYHFDLKNYHQIQNHFLRDHIDRVGIEIYHKTNSTKM